MQILISLENHPNATIMPSECGSGWTILIRRDDLKASDDMKSPVEDAIYINSDVTVIIDSNGINITY